MKSFVPRLTASVLLALALPAASFSQPSVQYRVGGKDFTFQVDPDVLFVEAALPEVPNILAGDWKAESYKLAAKGIEAQAKVIEGQLGTGLGKKLINRTPYLNRLKNDVATGVARPDVFLMGGACGALTPRIPGLGTAGGLPALSQELERNTRVVYKYEEGGLTYRVLPLKAVTVRFKAQPTAELLAQLRRDYNLAAPVKRAALPDTYRFALGAKPGELLGEPFEVHSRLLSRHADKLVWAQVPMAFEVRVAGVKKDCRDDFPSPARGTALPDVFRFAPGAKPGRLPADLSNIRGAAAQKGDPLFERQWYFADTPAGLRVKAAWAAGATRGSPDVTIAVLDCGIDIDHEDLNPGVFVHPYDALNSTEDSPVTDPRPRGPEAHGTAVCGILASVPDNGIGCAGIAPGCKIVPVRAYDESGFGGEAGTTSDAIVLALRHARASGAKVITLSAWFPRVFIEGEAANLLDEILARDDMLVVAAAGNGDDAGQAMPVVYPASHGGRVIAVGAVDKHNLRLPYSNYTRNQSVVTVVAPSAPRTHAFADIVTTDATTVKGYNRGGKDNREGDEAGNYYYHFTGTSAATPQVTGTVALIWSVNPRFTASEVKEILESTADKVDPGVVYTNGRNDQYGYGKVNAVKAVEEAVRRVRAGGAPPVKGVSQVAPSPRPAPSPKQSRAEAEITALRSLVKNGVAEVPIGVGKTKRFKVNAEWVGVVADDAKWDLETQITTLLRPDAGKGDDRGVRVVVRAHGRTVAVIRRAALLSEDKLLEVAKGHTQFPSIQPVLEADDGPGWIIPLGTLSVVPKDGKDVSNEEIKRVLSDAGLTLYERKASIVCELDKPSKFGSIFEVGVELGKRSELFKAVRLDYASSSPR